MPHGCIALSLVQLQFETDSPPQLLLAAPAQLAELTPRQRVRAVLCTDVASLAEAHPALSGHSCHLSCLGQA